MLRMEAQEGAWDRSNMGKKCSTRSWKKCGEVMIKGGTFVKTIFILTRCFVLMVFFRLVFFHKDLLSCLLKLTHPRNYDLLVLWDHPLHIFEPHNQQLWDSNTQSLTTALRDSARRGCHNPLCLTWVFTAPWDLHTSKNPPQYTSRLGHLVRYIQSFGDISSLQKKSI